MRHYKYCAQHPHTKELEELKQRVARQTINRADVMRMQNEKYVADHRAASTTWTLLLNVATPTQGKAGRGVAVCHIPA